MPIVFAVCSGSCAKKIPWMNTVPAVPPVNESPGNCQRQPKTDQLSAIEN
jgi:hypothetical protein